MFARRRHHAGAADLGRDRAHHAEDFGGGRARVERVRYLPQVGGGRGVDRYQCSDLDQREGSGIQAAALLPCLPERQRRFQHLEVA